VSGQPVEARGHASTTVGFLAYLTHSDRVPLILGFADVLASFPLHGDYRQREAWVEVP